MIKLFCDVNNGNDWNVQNQESLTTSGNADNFKSFKNLYSRSLPIGKYLSSAKAKSVAGEKYDKLYESFRVCSNQSSKCVRWRTAD